MATITAVVRTSKQRADKTVPIYIRVSEGTRNKYLSVGKAVLEKDWDENLQKVRRSHPNYDYINSMIALKKNEAEKSVLEVMLTNNGDDILDSIKLKEEKKGECGFFTLAEEYLKDLYLNKKFTRLSAEKYRVKQFKSFLDNRDIDFSKIDITLLNKFATHLRSLKKKDKTGKYSFKCNQRTMMNHMVVIRTIYNLGIQRKLASADNYPFGKKGFKIKYPETTKIGLNEAEIRLLELADLSQKPDMDHVRKIWLFSFYMAGMRISDVLRLDWSDFIDNRLNYTMGKNKKQVSLRLPEKAAAIIEHYMPKDGPKTGFVFPDMKNVDHKDEEKLYRNVTRITAKFDKILKSLGKELGIIKPLTNHISRHTFGNITGDKISPQMLQKLYRHSHISTTMGYQANFIHKDVDDALDKVLDF